MVNNCIFYDEEKEMCLQYKTDCILKDGLECDIYTNKGKFIQTRITFREFDELGEEL